MSEASSSAVEIRLATAQDAVAIAETHVASWKATYPGIVPQTYIDSLNADEFAERWQSRLVASSDTIITVAERAGSVCGFASGGPARKEIPGYSGELYALYLSPDACGQGIGSRLFRAIAESLRRSGHRGMYVWVLEENPSRRFYERMGGRPLTSAKIEIGGKTLTEVSYGWPDIWGSR